MGPDAVTVDDTTYLKNLDSINFFLDTMEMGDDIFVNNDGTNGKFGYWINRAFFGYTVTKEVFYFSQGEVVDSECVVEIDFDTLDAVKKYFAL